MDLGETVQSVCSETCLTLSADGCEVSNVRAEEVLHTQKEEDRLAVALPAVKAADKVCYVCIIVVLTVVQACTLASVFQEHVLCCVQV
jgi:hypothetical protein